jgi:hypothetical protein
MSVIFSDSRSAYIVSFFYVGFLSHSFGRNFLTLCLQILCHFFLTLSRFFKNDTTSADLRSQGFKNDYMSVVVLKNDFMSVRRFVIFVLTLCFFCSKFDRHRIIFSDFVSVIEKRIYVGPTMSHF